MVDLRSSQSFFESIMLLEGSKGMASSDGMSRVRDEAVGAVF